MHVIVDTTRKNTGDRKQLFKTSSNISKSIINLNYRPENFFGIKKVNEKNSFIEIFSIEHCCKSIKYRPSVYNLVGSLTEDPIFFWVKPLGSTSSYKFKQDKRADVTKVDIKVVNKVLSTSGDLKDGNVPISCRCYIPDVVLYNYHGKLILAVVDDSLNLNAKNQDTEMKLFIDSHKEDIDYFILGECSNENIGFSHYDYAIIYKYDGKVYVNAIQRSDMQKAYRNVLITLNNKGQLKETFIKDNIEL